MIFVDLCIDFIPKNPHHQTKTPPSPLPPLQISSPHPPHPTLPLIYKNTNIPPRKPQKGRRRKIEKCGIPGWLGIGWLGIAPLPTHTKEEGIDGME